MSKRKGKSKKSKAAKIPVLPVTNPDWDMDLDFSYEDEPIKQTPLEILVIVSCLVFLKCENM